MESHRKGNMELRRNIMTWYTWLGYIFALSIALPRPFSTWIFAIWGLFTLGIIIYDFIGGKHSFGGWRRADLPCLLLLALALLGLVSAGVAEQPDLVFRKTFGPRFSLIVLPVFALLLRRAVDTRGMLKYFVAGNALSIALSVYFVAYKVFSGEELELYRDFFSNFTEVCTGFIHRTYLGLNILLSYVAVAYLTHGRTLGRGERCLWVLYLMVSLAFLLMSGSRIVVLCIPMLAVYYLIIGICGVQGGKQKLVFLGGIAIIVLVGVFFMPTRMGYMLSQEGACGMLANDPRAEIWPNVWAMIQERPLLGFGLDNIEAPLVSSYLSHGFLEGVAFRYAPHNEYLSEWAQMGFGGVLLLVAILLSLPLSAGRTDRKLIWPISIVFAIVFLSESMLDRYMGCLTFAFFVSLMGRGRSDDGERNIGGRYIKILIPVLLLIPVLFLISALRTSCFAPQKLINVPNNDDGKDIFEMREGNFASFLHGGQCVKRLPIAYCDLREGESTSFSISCRCGAEFDGSSIRIIAERDMADGTHIPTQCAYDLNRKGEWQELGLELSGRQTILIYLMGGPEIHSNGFRGSIFFKKPYFISN